MPVKKIIIKLFPSLYIKKNFSDLDKATFLNYRQTQIEPELLLLPFLVKKEKGFVDVGSNKGAFLFSALKFLKPGNIFGFEPNPVLYNKIRFVFKQVTIFNVALSDRSGEAVLTIPFTQNQPDDSLGTINGVEVSGNAFNFKVPLKTLDDCLEPFSKTNIGLIKIDVEGHELDVINGAQKIIQNNLPVLIVEIEQRHHQTKIEKIIEGFCSKYNYKAFYFFPNKNQIFGFNNEPVVYQDLRDFGTSNYVNNFIFIAQKNKPDELIADINSQIAKLTKK